MILFVYPLKVNRILNVVDPIPWAPESGITTVDAGMSAVGEIDQTVPQVIPSVDVSTFKVKGFVYQSTYCLKDKVNAVYALVSIGPL
jgi:hypothetical protein